MHLCAHPVHYLTRLHACMPGSVHTHCLSHHWQFHASVFKPTLTIPCKCYCKCGQWLGCVMGLDNTYTYTCAYRLDGWCARVVVLVVVTVGGACGSCGQGHYTKIKIKITIVGVNTHQYMNKSKLMAKSMIPQRSSNNSKIVSTRWSSGFRKLVQACLPILATGLSTIYHSKNPCAQLTGGGPLATSQNIISETQTMLYWISHQANPARHNLRQTRPNINVWKSNVICFGPVQPHINTQTNMCQVGGHLQQGGCKLHEADTKAHPAVIP